MTGREGLSRSSIGGTRGAQRLRAASGAERGRFLWTHLGKPASYELLLVQLRRLDEARAALLAQAVAVAADRDDLAMVEQAIEDRRRHDGIAEHGSPLADRTIAGEQEAAALVAARDELEEEMGGLGLEGKVADGGD